MLHFRFLTGDVNWQQYGGKFISKRLNNGDFDYWMILDVINMHDATGDEDQEKYCIELRAVSPQQAAGSLERAFESCGWEGENNPIIQAEVLDSYGVHAVLWVGNGNNITSLLKQAREQANLANMLFRFYMDRPENGIGQSGWDLIRGQDIREHLDSLKA